MISVSVSLKPEIASLNRLGFANPKPEIRTSDCWKLTIPVRVPPYCFGVSQKGPKFTMGCGSQLSQQRLIWGVPQTCQKS